MLLLVVANRARTVGVSHRVHRKSDTSTPGVRVMLSHLVAVLDCLMMLQHHVIGIVDRGTSMLEFRA
jgi:hypothetical protein